MENKRLKVAIDCRMINCSGIGTFLSGILPHLLSSELDFVLLGNKNELKKYKKQNVKIIPCDIPIFSIKELLKFPSAKINECDLYFTPNYNIPCGVKIPIICTIHDVLFLDMPNLTSKLGYFIRKIALIRAARISSHILTVSQFSKERILHHTHTSTPITICYNGADNRHTFESTHKSPIDIGEYYVYIGNIKPHKGLKTLLTAFNSIKDDYPDRKLIIIGNKDNFKTSDAELSNLINQSKHSDSIIFTGFVSEKELTGLLSSAICLIQPSEYEGFGIPPLEAMKSGTPCIISDIQVFKELYADFPVHFFNVGNAVSLANEMIKPHERIHLSKDLDNRYSYKKTSQILMSVINSFSS